LQEQGRILVDVINYLEDGDDDHRKGDKEGGDERGGGGGGGGSSGHLNLTADISAACHAADHTSPPVTLHLTDDEPYPGPEGLNKLWNEVLELCAEEDVPRLDEEVRPGDAIL